MYNAGILYQYISQPMYLYIKYIELFFFSQQSLFLNLSSFI